MEYSEQLPLWYAMAARPPLFPEVPPRLMRQSLVLFGDLVNSGFHFVKTYSEPAVDLMIAAEQEK